MGKKRKKRTDALSTKRQCIHYEPVLVFNISKGQSNDIRSEQIKILESIFQTRTSQLENQEKRNMPLKRVNISKRQQRFLKEKGIRIEKVDQQVDKIVRMIQNNGFTLDESELIANYLLNNIKQARYRSGGTLLSEINDKKSGRNETGNDIVRKTRHTNWKSNNEKDCLDCSICYFCTESTERFQNALSRLTDEIGGILEDDRAMNKKNMAEEKGDLKKIVRKTRHTNWKLNNEKDFLDCSISYFCEESAERIQNALDRFTEEIGRMLEDDRAMSEDAATQENE